MKQLTSKLRDQYLPQVLGQVLGSIQMTGTISEVGSCHKEVLLALIENNANGSSLSEQSIRSIATSRGDTSDDVEVSLVILAALGIIERINGTCRVTTEGRQLLPKLLAASGT